MSDAGTPPEQTKPQPSGFLDFTKDTLSFGKIVVYGLLFSLVLIVALSFVLSVFPKINEKMAEFSLSFYKDIALILVGALANSVSHKENKKNDQP